MKQDTVTVVFFPIQVLPQKENKPYHFCPFGLNTDVMTQDLLHCMAKVSNEGMGRGDLWTREKV